MQLGNWKSKETGKLAKLVQVDEFAVWYEIPEWNGPQNCAKNVWLESMIPCAPGSAS